MYILIKQMILMAKIQIEDISLLITTINGKRQIAKTNWRNDLKFCIHVLKRHNFILTWAFLSKGSSFEMAPSKQQKNAFLTTFFTKITKKRSFFKISKKAHIRMKLLLLKTQIQNLDSKCSKLWPVGGLPDTQNGGCFS